MKQSVLIDNNPQTKDLISQGLDTMAGTQIVHHASGTDLIKSLKFIPSVTLIVTRNKIDGEDTAQILYDYITQEALPISLIVIGENENIKDSVHCLKDPVDMDLLLHLVTDHLATKNEVPQNMDFEPLGLQYFYDIPWAPCDIYIRIKKDNTQFKYYKRMNALETFDRNTINRYHDQGLVEFYIQRKDKNVFITFVSKELIEKLKSKETSNEELLSITEHTREIVREVIQKSGMDASYVELTKAYIDSIEETLKMTSNAHQIVREVVQKSGLDEASIELSSASLNSIVSSVIYSPEMSGVLKILLSDRISYAYQMCHLQSLMCHYILTRQNWYKSSHLETLSFVSFFTDIALQTQEQMEIGSMSQLDASKLSSYEKKLVLEHSKLSLKAVESHPLLSPDTRTVMSEAQGNPLALGIEECPGEELHDLSKIFIIADSFVKILLNPEMPSSKKEILPLLYERFTNPSYQRIIKTLESKFSKNRVG